MYRPQQLGKLVSRICQERGLSAFAASKAARLSMNQIRNMQRGLHRPSPRVLETFVRALGIGLEQAAELRRLAGIDPDPAATPGARKARRAAWPILTYILANHVLLPRLQLTQTLRAKDRRAPGAASALRSAAADNLFTHCQQAASSSRPPRALATMLENTFGHLDADTVERIRRNAAIAGGAWGSEQAAPVRHAHSVGDREIVLPALIGFRSPGITEMRAFLRVAHSAFNPIFALRLFPLIYAEACRNWPFSKVFMPHACYGESVQQQFYELVRAGASAEDLDSALLAPGALARERRQRQPCEIGKPQTEVLRPIVSWKTGDGRTRRIDVGWRPAEIDRVFDHLDRWVFLDRFPLIKLAPEAFGKLASSHSLPSWSLWRDLLLRSGAPAEVLDNQPLAEPLQPGPFDTSRPESPILRLIGDLFRERADLWADRDLWTDIVNAGRALRLEHAELLAVAEALAAAQPPVSADHRPPAAASDPPADSRRH